MALVAWLSLSLPPEQAAAAAAVLVGEDFAPADLADPRTAPDQADLAELFPEQPELIATLLQAIDGRQTLEAWLQQRAGLAASVAASAGEVLQHEDFACPTDLAKAALTREDLEDLFPSEPGVVNGLLGALQPPPAGAAAGATATSAGTATAEGPIEAWLRRQQLPSIDAAACASAFVGEGFDTVSAVVSAALTRADLEELFPRPEDQSTVTQLFGLLSEQEQNHVGASRYIPTPTEAAAPASTTAKPQPKPAKRKKASTLRKPPPLALTRTLHKRPPIDSRILVQFADTCYPDRETWTLDATKNNFCFHDDGHDEDDDADADGDADGKEEERTTEPVKKKLKKHHKRRPDAGNLDHLHDSESDSDSDTPLSWTGQGPTGFPPRFSQSKVPSGASASEPAAAGPAAAAAPRPKPMKQKLSSPKLTQAEDRSLSTEPSVHRVIARHAPLYTGNLHMLNRKLQGHIEKEQPPGWQNWEGAHIQKAISELLYFDIPRKCFLLKESLSLFLTKDEAKHLRYKKGIFKDEDILTKSSALSRLSHRNRNE